MFVALPAYQEPLPVILIGLKEILLPVHPFSRKILLSEYSGQEPLRIPQHDILFSMLCVTRIRDRSNLSRLRPLLTVDINIALDKAMATHIVNRCYQSGLHLFKWHKDMLCRHTEACVRQQNSALAGIRDFYTMHDIGEDDLPMDTAYKIWQRWNWNLKRKNEVFFGKKRGKAGVFNSNPPGRPQKVEIPVCDNQIECMAERIVDIASACLSTVPSSLPKHIRCYLYLEYAKRNHLQISQKLAVPVSTLYYGASVIRNWKATDTTFSRLFDKVCDLPQACS